MSKLNLHIVIPQEMFDKLKREGLVNNDRLADINNVWITPTGLKRIHITAADADSTPYTHLATCMMYRDEFEVDTKTTPM